MFKIQLVGITTFPMNLLSFLLLYFLHLYHVCNAEELVESDIDCDVGENCTNVNSCIGNYYDLKSYIKGNRAFMETFKHAYFVTDKIPSAFVIIIYNFQLVDSSDGNVLNCSNHQTTYIWSQKLLYLLGPGPLYWYTFLAVTVPEYEITINLPCLYQRRDAYSDLLSRLTYMVWYKGVYVQHSHVVIMHICIKL